MERNIQLTRRAIKDLQGFQSCGLAKISEELSRWKDGDYLIRAKYLSGDFSGLRSHRINAGNGVNLRLVFKELGNTTIRVFYVAKRDEETYKRSQLAYTYNGEIGAEWSVFLNGGYNYSPVLTESQQEMSQSIGKVEEFRRDIVARITQSPPGTGKTVTAALRACELYESNGLNVIFLLPERLLGDVRKFKVIRDQEPRNDSTRQFFLGTLQQWIQQEYSEISFLSLVQELNIISSLAEKAEKLNRHKGLKLGEIKERDFYLFHSYVVVNRDIEPRRCSAYRENQKRIEELRHIDMDLPRWYQEVRTSNYGKASRSQIPDLIAQIRPQKGIGTIVIIDEAQDYFLRELHAVIDRCRVWQQNDHSTDLWLLGDLNQRINPVDFDWGALHLTRAEDPGWESFRNSRNILKFSNCFLGPPRKIKYGRTPPDPIDPERAFGDGERVKVLRYRSEREAKSFLERLAEMIQSESTKIAKSRSIIHRLASRIEILASPGYGNHGTLGLEFIDVHEAKGREFDSCIVFNVFLPSSKEPTPEEWRQWYTLLTRTRLRLLIVITDSQKKLLVDEFRRVDEFRPWIFIPRDPFRDLNRDGVCELLDSDDPNVVDNAIGWIQGLSNDIQLSSDQNQVSLVENHLKEALETEQPVIYWDTYKALDLVGITEEKRTNLEREMLRRLRGYLNYPEEIRHDDLEELLADVSAQDERLKCLLHRSIGDYWEAAEAVENLKSSDFREYERIINAIAEDLESPKHLGNLEPLKLEAEAAWLRFKKLDPHLPPNLDDLLTPELIQELNHEQGPLIPALVRIMRNRWSST